MSFMPFDKVMYTGEKFRGDIKEKLGEIVSRVEGRPGAYVVEFGDNSYIMGEQSFRRHRLSAKELNQVEVINRRSSDEEDGAV